MIRYTKEYIGKLLARFMDGETSIEEEDVLSEYFRTTPDVPEEWRDYQAMFAEWEPAPCVPVSKGRHRWPWVAAAAAAVAAVLYVAMPSQHTEQPPVAQAGVAPADGIITPPGDSTAVAPDTVAAPAVRPHAPKRRRRPPRIDDDVRDYALMAQAREAAEQVRREQENVEREVMLVQEEVFHARMTALGYIRVRHEDGTIEYRKENEITNYYAYDPD